MTIDSKGWTARQDGNQLYVEGTVTVAHPGIDPVLEPSRLQDRSFNLNLDLKLQEQDGSFIQVLTEKTVTFEKTVNNHVPVVHVLSETGMVTSLAVARSEA